MQLDHVAERVAHEHLIRILADETLDAPVPDAALVEFPARGLNVLHRQGDVGQGRVLFLGASIGDMPLAPMR